jgi:(p)ppGpp synthase/HD superfamily hydrolase
MIMKVEKRMNVLQAFVGILTPHTLEAAIVISAFLHQGVKDRGGRPYICHPMWIYAELVRKCVSTETLIVAMLHDVVEDTALTMVELAQWFSPTICTAVDAISKRDGETGDEYLIRVAMDPIARVVKKEDLRHNMDITRLKNRGNLSAKDLARIADYAKKYDFLVGGQHNV